MVENFRGYPIGLVTDIEKAFHKEPPTIKEYEFRSLPFGLTPSPAILPSTISQHLVSLLCESIYVDDFAGGAADDDQALRI